MQLIQLNNVGRKFHKYINNDEFLRGTSNFKNFNLESSEFWALRNIYMNINEGEIIGIIGRNGSGKSTLLNIIAGNLPVSEGEITVKGKVSALLTLGAGFQDELTGKENIYLNATLLGYKKQDIGKNFLSILEYSELGDFIDAPIGTYSGGMKMRLGFSIAIHKDFDILVTDEVIAVGDVYFQKKCLEKMVDFKRQGKTMLIATQDLSMIERFCDRAYLLEDGQIIFSGAPSEAAEKYRMLLNKKKVLSETFRTNMVKETKRWASDLAEWGRREGTKEVVIKEVVILNKWGLKTNKVKLGDRITARAYFSVKEEIDNFHFGIAIFREDGVYCYGPNTKFDGLSIEHLSKGDGYFELNYKELLLMPGTYYISVAVWDSEETLAYDYHKCKYKIEVVGALVFGQLLSLPSMWNHSKSPNYSGQPKIDYYPNLDYLADKWGSQLKNDLITLESVKCLNNYGIEDSVFVTGRGMKIKVDFKIDKSLNKSFILWLGTYRSDGIYCDGSIKKITAKDINSEILIYPKLRLLPGGYKISVGIWDLEKEIFLMYSHGIHSFNMISEKRDHGTVYLEHHWNWRIPKGGPV